MVKPLFDLIPFAFKRRSAGRAAEKREGEEPTAFAEPDCATWN